MYGNSTNAFCECLKLILEQGQLITVRGQEIKEIISHTIGIYNPRERVIVVPHRANNIFATIAESIWVIGGRNDLEFLLHYLPIAADYSDDGKVWRAGYGNRLRHWSGQVDQIKEIVSILSRDRNSRRAVMIIFNPAEDYIDSKDVPCNNWIQFIIRDNKLHMNVAVRSNDIMWGFSGINTFEWSVLQEMMAYWLNVEVGSSHYFIGSLHLYNRHFKRAQRIINNLKDKTIYDFGFVPLKFQTPFSKIATVLSNWFEIETKIRSLVFDVQNEIDKIDDDFLKYSLYMLFIYNNFLNGAEQEDVFRFITKMPICDYRIAAIEFFWRRNRNSELSMFSSQESHFLEYLWPMGEK